MTHERITVDDVLALRPCPTYTRSRVEELGGGRESMTLLDVLDLDIPAQDRLWLALRPEFFSEEELRLMAADFAERAVLAHWRNRWDFRPAAAVVAARRFALEEIGEAELAAAEAASWDTESAAAAAARAAANAAARAPWDAAEAAASAAARAAASARAAAWGTAFAPRTAGAAEREAQVAIVQRYLEVQQ